MFCNIYSSCTHGNCFVICQRQEHDQRRSLLGVKTFLEMQHWPTIHLRGGAHGITTHGKKPFLYRILELCNRKKQKYRLNESKHHSFRIWKTKVACPWMRKSAIPSQKITYAILGGRAGANGGLSSNGRTNVLKIARNGMHVSMMVEMHAQTQLYPIPTKRRNPKYR